MRRETFTGPSITQLMNEARSRIGPDAMVLSVRRLASPGGLFELVAAPPAPSGIIAEPVRALRPRPAVAEPLGDALLAASGPRPFVLALVGPTGAGKTTTLAKLATHPAVFGDRSVGLVSLDTMRVGAVEQARIHARLARIPLEVVYEKRDVFRALRHLKHCEVILVDTPGRGPGEEEDAEAVGTRLRLLHPHETHLVLPTGLSESRARRAVAAYRALGITHLLPTKMDEERDGAPFRLAAEGGLEVRWLADGQRVPQDLQPVGAWLARHGRHLIGREQSIGVGY